MTQHEKIAALMIRNKQQTWFFPYDFMPPRLPMEHECFVGYEATARISELADKFPEMIEKGREGKYRKIRFRFENTQEIIAKLPIDWSLFVRKEFNKNGISYKVIQNFAVEGKDKNSVRMEQRLVEGNPNLK